jgi:hypothetical protein
MRGISAVRIGFACLLAGGTLIATGCAHGDREREREPGAALPADCVILRTVQDYDALDGDDLIIYGPARTAYHVVLVTPSNDIEGEFMIGIYDDGDGRICPYGRDAIIIEGTMTEEIRIRSIESLDEAELEALQVEFGEIEAAGPDVVPEQIL